MCGHEPERAERRRVPGQRTMRHRPEPEPDGFAVAVHGEVERQHELRGERVPDGSEQVLPWHVLRGWTRPHEARPAGRMYVDVRDGHPLVTVRRFLAAG